MPSVPNGKIRMRLPAVKILLLACIAFWGSGAARFLHEQLEHRHCQCIGGTGAVKADTCGQSHDQCAISPMLATMKAAAVAPPLAILPSHPLAGSALNFDCQAPLAAFVQFPFSRGPPAARSIFSA